STPSVYLRRSWDHDQYPTTRRTTFIFLILPTIDEIFTKNHQLNSLPTCHQTHLHNTKHFQKHLQKHIHHHGVDLSEEVRERHQPGDVGHSHNRPCKCRATGPERILITPHGTLQRQRIQRHHAMAMYEGGLCRMDKGNMGSREEGYRAGLP